LPKLRITNSKGRVLADRADLADTIAKRNTGLLKHLKLDPGEGLLIPTQAVHTFRMNFPIDIAFLSKKRKVLKIRANMVRGRISMSLAAHSVLELPAGTLAETETAVGDQLVVEKYEG
jgi:uncharacterized membrane protein (UPF0127 family)